MTPHPFALGHLKSSQGLSKKSSIQLPQTHQDSIPSPTGENDDADKFKTPYHPHCMFIASVDHHYSGSGPIIQWQSCGSSVHPFLSRALIGTMSHCSFFILLKKQGLGRLRGGLQGSFDTPPFLSFSILNYFNKALLYIALASMQYGSKAYCIINTCFKKPDALL